MHGQDRDSIIFQLIFGTLTILFYKCMFFRGKISVRSVLDLDVKVLDL